MASNKPPAPPPITYAELQEAARLPPTEKLREIQRLLTRGPELIDTKLLRDEMRIVSVDPDISSSNSNSNSSPPRLQFEIKVEAHHLNSNGTLHGAVQTLIYGGASIMAMMSIGKPGRWQYGGVGRTLSITYLRPAFEGQVLVVGVEVLNAGRNLATLKGQIMRKTDGALISICENNKVNTDPSVVAGSKL